MIVAVTRVVMLVIRLDLFLGPALIAVLPVRMSWIETGDREGGKQEAKHAHRSSLLPGDSINMIRARLLMTWTG